MEWLIKAGGAPNLVILLFGFIAIGAAAGFAWRPETRKLPHLGALCAAVFFSTICGAATDFAAVSHYIEANGEALGSKFGTILVIGIGESLAPVILGFAFLSIVALIAAIGFRRLSR